MRIIAKNKKWLFFIILISSVLITFGAIYFYQVFQNPNITGELSSRSREFIEKQKKEGNAKWRFIDFEKDLSTDTRNTRVEVGDNCFSFVILYKIDNFRASVEEPCSVFISFQEPRGSIVAFMREGKATSFDDVEGVRFRRLYTEKYSEEEIEVNGSRFLVFKAIDEKYEKSAFYYEVDNFYLVFNLFGGVGEDLDRDFEKMIKSIEIDRGN